MACGELTGAGICRLLSEMECWDGESGDGENGADPAEGDCERSI